MPARACLLENLALTSGFGNVGNYQVCDETLIRSTIGVHRRDEDERRDAHRKGNGRAA